MFREKTTLLEKVLATLIHDIKNPLSGISGFVQLIDQKSDDDDIKKFCGIILDSLAQLSDIFTQFNAIVSGRVSPLKKSKLLVSEFINDIVDSVRETYSFNGITVTSLCEEGLVVAGEKAKLGAVFKYILKNAKEAMPEGGTVTIQAKKENGEVFFSVSDTGKGIPALMQDSVFEPFVSYDKENAAGLGLAMARKIIKDHGGTISVTSFLGKGTLFTIHLPMLPKEAAP
jgi:signal transduction histidine kinase